MHDLLAAHLVHGLVEHAAEHVEADARDVARLLAAEQIARAAQLEVERRDLEAAPELGVPLERLDARARLVGHRVGGRDDEVAVRALLAPADAPAELVELREAEEVGAVDDHGVRARDVEAALDDRRRRRARRSGPSTKSSIASSSAASPICPCATAMRAVGHELLEALRLLVEPVDAVVDVEDCPPRASSRCTASRTTWSSQRVTIVRTARRSTGAVVMSDRSRRPVDGHLQRARDGRRREREHVDLRAELLDALLVRDAEALLLVDDEQAQVLEVDVLREEAVRPDDDVDLAVLERR